VSKPFAGVRILDFTRYLAGPYGTYQLALLGADVVKIEARDGDETRHQLVAAGEWSERKMPPGFLAVNANKRSMTVDLKDTDAVAALVALIGEADVLVQNMRPGSLDALGLGAETLTKKYPKLVYCSVWAFGRTGPMKLKPGYEPLLQAFSGLMMQNGDEGGPPTRIGTSILDYGTGMWTAIGALAGLVHRAATGKGCVVDASLFETGLAWLKGHFASYRASGEVPSAIAPAASAWCRSRASRPRPAPSSWPPATIASSPSSPPSWATRSGPRTSVSSPTPRAWPTSPRCWRCWRRSS